MSDIVERLINISRGDHERGCNGRSYTCSCGYDDVNEKTAEDAASEIQRLRAEVERLRKIISDCADATGAFVAPTCSLEFMEGLPNEIRLSRAGLRAEAFERAAQIADVQSDELTSHARDLRYCETDRRFYAACAGRLHDVARAIRAEASKKGGEG